MELTIEAPFRRHILERAFAARSWRPYQQVGSVYVRPKTIPFSSRKSPLNFSSIHLILLFMNNPVSYVATKDGRVQAWAGMAKRIDKLKKLPNENQ